MPEPEAEVDQRGSQGDGSFSGDVAVSAAAGGLIEAGGES